MNETCMFCSELDRKNQNKSGELWCKKKNQFVSIIDKKCESFVSLTVEVNNAE